MLTKVATLSQSDCSNLVMWQIQYPCPRLGSDVWGAVCFRSSSERAVTDVRDGPPGGTFETDGTDSWRRLLQKSVRAGRGGGPWTAGRDGPPERTFETNGTDSWRRLLQKFVRAGRGQPAVTGPPLGRDFWNKRHGFLAPIVAEVRQSGPWGRAVDGRPWRAAGTDFWNKRHGFLAPIVAEVRQSGPWTAGRDGPPGGTFEQTARIPGADCCRSPSERAVGAGRGRTAVTGRRNGLLKQTARIPGADCCRSSSERAVVAGRGRPAVTGRRDGLLKQTAQIPGADCCRSPSERAVDGRPWRAAGKDFWNKRHRFLAPIVAEVRQSGPWEPALDGRPWRAAGDGLLKQTARIPGADCFKSLSDRAVGAGRGRLAVTGIHLPVLDHTRETPFQHNLHIKQCLRHYVQEAIFTWMTEKQTPQCYHR